METKKVFKYFSIFKFGKEEKFLREMHKSGWKFIKVTGIGTFHFVKCEPEDVIYQLDYNQEGLRNKDEYIKMFSDCGWEYLQEFAGYTYFRKPSAEMNGNEEIFSDADSKLQMMKHMLLGRMLPMLIIFTAIIIPNCIKSFFIENDYIFGFIFLTLLLVYVSIFIYSGSQYIKFKKKHSIKSNSEK